MIDGVLTREHPAYRETIDPNALHAAAERVADWHIRNCTPEFVEWLDDSYAAGRIEMQTIAAILCALPREAHLVQKAKGLADTILGDFRTFVANAADYHDWPMARRVADEVRRESGLPDGDDYDDYDDGSNDEDFERRFAGEHADDDYLGRPA